MTCAMDWSDYGETFYDSWICRGMTGDLFIEVPQSGSFDFKHNLFWNDPKTKTRFEAKLPFQVPFTSSRTRNVPLTDIIGICMLERWRRLYRKTPPQSQRHLPRLVQR